MEALSGEDAEDNMLNSSGLYLSLLWLKVNIQKISWFPQLYLLVLLSIWGNYQRQLHCSCVFHVFSHLEVDIIGQYDYELSIQREREREGDQWLSWQQKMMRCLLQTEFCTRIHIKPHLRIGVGRTLLETVHSFFQKHLLHLCSFTPGYVEDVSLRAQPRTEQTLLFPKGFYFLVQEWGSFPDCKSAVWKSQPVNCLLFI